MHLGKSFSVIHDHNKNHKGLKKILKLAQAQKT